MSTKIYPRRRCSQEKRGSTKESKKGGIFQAERASSGANFLWENDGNLPKRKGPHRTKAKRGVYLAIQATLPKAKPKKEESTAAQRRSGKYYKYH